MTTVYIEARPKGRPEGSAIDDFVVEEMPRSKHNEKQSIGQKRTAIRRMSLASDT